MTYFGIRLKHLTNRIQVQHVLCEVAQNNVSKNIYVTQLQSVNVLEDYDEMRKEEREGSPCAWHWRFHSIWSNWWFSGQCYVMYPADKELTNNPVSTPDPILHL
jgi:hypothetical protein